MNGMEFHFIRPAWLLLLPALICLFVWWRSKPVSSGWEQIIPESMLRALSTKGDTGNASSSYTAIFTWLVLILAALLISLALAGPSWDKHPQPATQSDRALLVLLDLSPSMLAEDLTPNRLTRTRFKLIDLLRARVDGQTALIAYAGGPHVVSPLTLDAATIETLVPVLHPALMPNSGSQVEDAVTQALELLAGSSSLEADLLLITDGVESQAISAIQNSVPATIRLSVMAVGTAEGAPIPRATGGFIRNSRDEIVVAGVNHAELRNLANSLGGTYIEMRADDSDITHLTAFLESGATLAANRSEGPEIEFDLWRDQGPWLVLLLLPILAWGFRKGLFFSIAPIAPLLTVLVLSTSGQEVQALEWESLWLNPDQRGEKRLEKGDPAGAAAEFENPQWQGYSHYQSGDFQTAAELFGQDSSARGRFNLGNALTQLGDYQKALQAYDQAAELDPDLEGLSKNRQIAEFLKQMQEQQENRSEQEQSGEQSKSGEQSEQENQSEQGDRSEGGEQQADSNSGGENESRQQRSEKGSEQNTAQTAGDSSESQDGAEDQSGQNSPQQAERSSGEGEPEPNSQAQSAQQSSQQVSPDPEPQQDSAVEPEMADINESDPSTADASEESASASALQQERSEENAADDPLQLAELPAGEPDGERSDQNAQWLRTIPDDPGGLLRRKFEYEAQLQEYLERFGPPNTTEHQERY